MNHVNPWKPHSLTTNQPKKHPALRMASRREWLGQSGTFPGASKCHLVPLARMLVMKLPQVQVVSVSLQKTACNNVCSRRKPLSIPQLINGSTINRLFGPD